MLSWYQAFAGVGVRGLAIECSVSCLLCVGAGFLLYSGPSGQEVEFVASYSPFLSASHVSVPPPAKFPDSLKIKTWISAPSESSLQLY